MKACDIDAMARQQQVDADRQDMARGGRAEKGRGKWERNDVNDPQLQLLQQLLLQNRDSYPHETP